MALAEEIARQAGQHEVWLALSGRFPDSVEPLRAAFADLIPAEHIRVFELPGPVAEIDLANAWRMQMAELLREKFLADLSPDIVHVSTLFEGLDNEVVASVGRLDTTVPTAVTLYDLDPAPAPGELPDGPGEKAILLAPRTIAEACRPAVRHFPVLAPGGSRGIAYLSSRIVEHRRRGGALVPIRGGVGEMKIALIARLGLQRPFVLYSGGVEPRKNLERLIEAFGLLPKDLRRPISLRSLAI